ncbi:type VI secretion system protein ImpL [Pseudomonas corrugata]|nr:type VI secretion protein IcmF/TssM N-terminal domain-containing protein [Pseudomonas corrugata]MDU9034644.1 type VI secretion protein IcmF/TssM N-terminal domain-containing protein [Pseudomonas corrugata]QTH12147.1 type VI secretion system protein ImpL [Pseudomonas corrugata]UZD93269.1 type VI secretion system protein ImpL [Pseudomonas corrugata]SDU90847.1 type VI secretion system protein ImpL [Pseudomonas corrugata]
MSPLSIIAVVVPVIVVVLVIAALIGWLRTQGGAAIRSFYGAVRRMEQEQGTRDRYQIPWLLMLGNETDGAQLCTQWHLQATDKAAWFGRWWSDAEGAVLVVPQALFLPDEGMNRQRGNWWRLLGLILRLRSRRPIDAVIWTVPFGKLDDIEHTTELSLKVRRCFIDLLQRFGLSLPVYVVITGMQELPGFQELVSALPTEAREATLGWSSPYSPDAAWQSHWSDQALDQVNAALSQSIIEIGALSGQLSGDLYGLPERFERLRRALQILLEPVFQGNAQGEAPRFRGVYFTATQAPTVTGDGFAASDKVLCQTVFARQLWARRFVAERGLAQPVPRLLRLRQRWHRLAGVVALVVGLVWLGGMLWVWHDSVEEAEELSQLILHTHKNYLVVDPDQPQLEPTRYNVQTYWNMLEKAPSWRYVAVVFPTSWFSTVDAQLEEGLRLTARHHWVLPLRDLLASDLGQLQAIRNTERRGNVESEDPAQWQSYVKAKDLVERAVRLEQQNQMFSQLVSNPKAPLDELVQLSNNALSLSLNAGTLSKARFYNRVLFNAQGAGLPGQDLQGLDLNAARTVIGDNFTGLMQRWLDHYFLADNFVRQAGYLKLHLQRLEAGSGNSLSELEDLMALVDDLQTLVNLTNAAWGRGKGQDLVPGYTQMMDKVSHSTLLGPELAQDLESQAAKLQQSFRDQWIVQTGSRDNLLVQQGSGLLVLQEHVTALDDAVKALFKRDFVALALQKDPSGNSSNAMGQGGGSDDFSVALNYFASYKSYANEELPRIPPDYRDALIQAAEGAAARAMWLSLDESEEQLPGMGFNVQTTQAVALQKAFMDVHRADLAMRFQRLLNRRALAQIKSGLDEIEAQPLFSQRADVQRWDGSKNFGLQLYGASDPQGLKLSLNQQFDAMVQIAEQRMPALEWLIIQQDDLSALEHDRVSRFMAINDELLKYKSQNPASSAAQLEQLVSRDFNQMDTSSCAQILQTSNLSGGRGDLAQRAVSLQQGALQRCLYLQQNQAATAWNDVANYFNQYLAGRFPFSQDLRASDADPARVQRLLELIDTRLPLAEAGLALSQTPERLAAENFLNRLKQAGTWLGPLFVRDKSGILGVEMDVRWRTDRNEERGADQVIAWGLNAGNQQINYPGDAQQNLRWMVGQPVRLTLRWARNGYQRPANDPLQPNLVVRDLEAGWEYQGPWALLRLMRSLVSVQRQPNVDYTDFPLTLQLPVTGQIPSLSPAQAQLQARTTQQTMMFMRLSLMSQGSKLPLSMPPLPTQAPRSPFMATSSSPAIATREEGL